MLAISLPSLPPPGTSLLPSLHDRRVADNTNTGDGQSSLQAQQQQQQRRARGSLQDGHSRNPLAILANEERVLEKRKQAIQMYGYSWLKPAGCTKTMLGRREEEIERDEVEKQLREVEMQERNAADIEEAERMAHQQRQRAQEDRGEVITGEEGERDLDDEVPDMDAQDDFEDIEDDEDEEEDEDENELEEGDLDDEIPQGDSGFAYDTTRDPDTESEDNDFTSSTRPRVPPGQYIPSSFNGQDQDLSEQEQLAHQMLDEDELGAHNEDRDLDNDLPDMDDEPRDLDDEVPDADEDDGGWEHTDTELDESDMDISIMPPGPSNQQGSMLPPSSNISHARRRQEARHSVASTQSRRSMASQQSDIDTGLRRSSGNVALPMAPPSSSASQLAGRRGLGRPRQAPPNFTPAQLDSDISVSALISTGNTGISSIGGNPVGASQRAWLDPASARRNLFGASRDIPAQPGDASRGSGTAVVNQPSRTIGTIPNLTRSQSGQGQSNNGNTRQVSSGGLFTPSPQHQSQQPGGRIDESVSRTRSGRVHGFIRGGGRMG